MARRVRVFLAALAIHATHCLGGEVPSANFTVDARSLACSPASFGARDTLELSLGKRHGRELGIERVADKAFFLLVVASSTGPIHELVPSSTFQAAQHLSLSPGVVASRSDGTAEQVFASPGKYTIYVSESLLSAAGGNKCEVNFRG